MVKHTQAIRRQFADELFGVFDHFVILALKGLNFFEPRQNNDGFLLKMLVILKGPSF